jgi:hypothetical protein
MRQLGRLIGRSWTLLRRRGVGYLGYLLTGFLLPRLAYYFLHEVRRSRLRRLSLAVLFTMCVFLLAILSWLTNAITAVLVVTGLVVLSLIMNEVVRRTKFARMRRQARELTERSRARQSPATFTAWSDLPVEAATRRAVEGATGFASDAEIAIARIDSDGRVLGLFGQIPGFANVEQTQFAERPRFQLDIVLAADQLLVRKDYRGDQAAFVNEWFNLALLSGKTNTPALHHVDEDRCRLYRNLVVGKTIREILVESGARILQAQTDRDTALSGLDHASRIEAVWERGREHIPACFPESFLDDLENQLEKIHAQKVAGVSVTYGNVIVESQTGKPFFIDFEKARAHRSLRGAAFGYQRDRDRVTFNRCYGRNLVTERSARAAVATESGKSDSWYAPIDFGGGLATPGFWSTESGTGRWSYLNGRILDRLVGGKRVLDLGSNNGVLPMMMLRAGAREVVALERSPELVETARVVHRLFEWRDLRRYALEMCQCDMLEVLREDRGAFDLVTAFCSLYYLKPEEMERVVRRVAELAPIMVVQAKTDTRADAAEQKAAKSDPAFLKQLLEENGFGQVDIFGPQDFSRPLLIGRKAAVEGAGRAFR